MAKVSAGAGIDAIAGKIGELVVQNSRGGLVLRQRPHYRRPTSPGQAAASARLGIASKSWAALPYPNVAEWNEYARREVRTNPVNGRRYAPAGYTAYVGLAVKILQIDPEAEIPAWPPIDSFPGDRLILAATTEPGAVVFTANQPNAPGVVTELLLQRLPGPTRTPTAKFKTMGFHSFEAGSLELAVPVEPGTYVPAYAFADPATGLSTASVVLERVNVELSMASIFTLPSEV